MQAAHTVAAEVGRLVVEADLVGSLPQTLYVDANVALDLARLDRFHEVLELVPYEPGVPRFYMMDEVASEVRHVYTSRGWGSDNDIDAKLDHPNLHLDDPVVDGTRGFEISRLRKRMADYEAATKPNLTDHPRRHLGEAATITYIDQVDPGSVFLTDDESAISFALEKHPNVVPMRSRVMLACAIANGHDIEALWHDICDSRRCEVDVPRCRTDGECPSLQAGARGRGVYPKDAASLVALLEGARRDVEVYLRQQP